MKGLSKSALLVLTLLLAGCAGGPLSRLADFTVADLQAAAVEGRAARTAGVLHAADRWPECFDDLAGRLAAVQPVDGVHGLAGAAMRAHIAKAKSAIPIDANCAQVILDLERDGLRVMKSLSPGGSLLPLR